MSAKENDASLASGVALGVAFVLVVGAIVWTTRAEDSTTLATQDAVEAEAGGDPSIATTPTTVTSQTAPSRSESTLAGSSAPRSGTGGEEAQRAATAVTPSTEPRSTQEPSKIPAGAGVQGVTDEIVQVGMVDGDLQAACTVIGTVAGSDTDCEDVTIQELGRAVAEEVNRTGGIGGRDLEIVWGFLDAAANATPEGRRQNAQRACASWTEDNQVFAFAGGAMSEEIHLQCALDANALIVPIGFQAYLHRERFERDFSELWYSTNWMLAEQREANLVNNLVARGALKPGDKVGYVIEDAPGTRVGVELGGKPALAEAGIELASEIVYPDFIESPWSTYVVQMRTAGVTHVIMSGTAGSLWSTLFMMRAAQDQAWFPTWGIATDNGPGALAGLNGPREQMANAAVMSWQSTLDGSGFDDTASHRRCRKVEEENGLPEDYGVAFCEVLFFIQEASRHAPELSPAGFAAAMDGLGSSYENIYGISGRTSFGPADHSGVALLWDAVYDPTCTDDGSNCWQYVGDPYPRP